MFQVGSAEDLVSLFHSTKVRTSARTQTVLFVFYAVHVQLKDSERQISPWMSLRRHRAPVPPLIRHGGRVIDSAWPSFHFLSTAPPLLLPLFCDTLVARFRCNSEGHACYTERCLTLDSRTKCHGNVNEVPLTFDTFTECPLLQRTLPLVQQ